MHKRERVEVATQFVTQYEEDPSVLTKDCVEKFLITVYTIFFLCYVGTFG